MNYHLQVSIKKVINKKKYFQKIKSWKGYVIKNEYDNFMYIIFA